MPGTRRAGTQAAGKRKHLGRRVRVSFAKGEPQSKSLDAGTTPLSAVISNSFAGKSPAPGRVGGTARNGQAVATPSCACLAL